MNIYACSVCFFNAPDDPMNISLRAAIIVMLLLLAFVLGLFAKFFLGIRKRSKLMARDNSGSHI